MSDSFELPTSRKRPTQRYGRKSRASTAPLATDPSYTRPSRSTLVGALRLRGSKSTERRNEEKSAVTSDVEMHDDNLPELVSVLPVREVVLITCLWMHD